LQKSLNIPASNGSGVDALTTALVNGDVVVIQQAEALKPNTGQDFVETVFDAPKSAAEPPPPADASSSSDSNGSDASSTPASSPTRAENATADGLTKASEEGTPFCEECAQGKSAA
jgi:hypothetical protein